MENPPSRSPASRAHEDAVARRKAWFVMPYFITEAAIAGVAAQGLLRDDATVSWAGALLVPGAFFASLGATVLRRRPRTSANLPGALALGGCGLVLAVIGVALEGALPPLLLAAVGYAGVLVYVFWYSRFGRRPAAALAAGRILPEFPLEDVDGQPRTSSEFHGSPAVFLFYRGNWCPLCMAQVRELAGQYRALAERGVRVALISPQPAEHTRRLAARFDVPFEFFVDRDSAAARRLGISHPGGLPAGMQVLGYDEETVLPTVVVTDATGRIVLADETDNYRLRPEPSTFLRALDAAPS